jgi:hypothetical protein
VYGGDQGPAPLQDLPGPLFGLSANEVVD